MLDGGVLESRTPVKIVREIVKNRKDNFSTRFDVKTDLDNSKPVFLLAIKNCKIAVKNY